MRTFVMRRLTAALLILPAAVSASLACESGHWIDQVLAEGKVIKLEDGSVWQVSALYVITSALWLPASEVVICDDGKLVNTDDGDSVSATRIR